VTVILISAGLAFLLTTALAVMLLLAERYLANYGTCKIDINSGEKAFEVTGGEPLLSTLNSQGIFIPSACGGRGTCAYCKVKIPDGAGPVAPTELPLLSEEEVSSSVRISCQVKVRNDLAIFIPEEFLAVQEFSGTVESIRDLTHDIKELRIALNEPNEINFTPGQYIQLRTPVYEKNPEPVFRAYSMSSVPSDKNHIELIIRLVPGGICTTWVFDYLKQGDEVNFTGSFGEFRISETDREMVWIAGGSGMAPFWSLLRHMKENDIRRPCTYFFGAVQKRDMFLVEQLQQLERELDWFKFIPALSAPAEGDQWSGETGLITEVVSRHISNGENMEGYLCGSPGMIDASIKVLQEKGITDDRIFFDKFA